MQEGTPPVGNEFESDLSLEQLAELAKVSSGEVEDAITLGLVPFETRDGQAVFGADAVRALQTLSRLAKTDALPPDAVPLVRAPLEPPKLSPLSTPDPVAKNGREVSRRHAQPVGIPEQPGDQMSKPTSPASVGQLDETVATLRQVKQKLDAERARLNLAIHTLEAQRDQLASARGRASSADELLAEDQALSDLRSQINRRAQGLTQRAETLKAAYNVRLVLGYEGRPNKQVFRAKVHAKKPG